MLYSQLTQSTVFSFEAKKRGIVRHGNRSGHCITSGPVSECMARDARRCLFVGKLDSESQ